jgi:hypothetical protein
MDHGRDGRRLYGNLLLRSPVPQQKQCTSGKYGKQNEQKEERSAIARMSFFFPHDPPPLLCSIP